MCGAEAKSLRPFYFLKLEALAVVFASCSSAPLASCPKAGIRRRLMLMSGHYLLKTEPSEYSFADLLRDKTTVWDGITNPTAVKNLREMKSGAQIIIYETGDRKSAVGTATAVSVDASDPKNPKVEIRAGNALTKPVSLGEIKANKLFATSPLLLMGRLSVVPLSAAQYYWLTRA